MPIEQEDLLNIIKKNFPQAVIRINDLVGDKDHYRIEITDSQFSNMTKIQQHKIVYKALENVLHKQLHAIELKLNSK